MKLNEIEQHDKFFDTLAGTYTDHEFVRELIQQAVKEKDLQYACEKFIEYLKSKGFLVIHEGSPVRDLLYDIRNETTGELFRVELYKTGSRHSMMYIGFYNNIENFRKSIRIYKLQFDIKGFCQYGL